MTKGELEIYSQQVDHELVRGRCGERSALVKVQLPPGRKPPLRHTLLKLTLTGEELAESQKSARDSLWDIHSSSPRQGKCLLPIGHK